MDHCPSCEPSAWIAALRLDDLEQYVLVVLVHSKRGIGHEAVSQLLSGLLCLTLRRAMRTKSPGTQESADEAADKPTLEAGASQSFAATRLG